MVGVGIGSNSERSFVNAATVQQPDFLERVHVPGCMKP